MVKLFHHTKNEVSMSRHSNAIAQTDTQTERHKDSVKEYYCLTYAGGNKNLDIRFCRLTFTSLGPSTQNINANASVTMCIDAHLLFTPSIETNELNSIAI